MSEIDAMERKVVRARRSFYETLRQLRSELSVANVFDEVARQTATDYGLLARLRKEARSRPVAAGMLVFAAILASKAMSRSKSHREKTPAAKDMTIQ